MERKHNFKIIWEGELSLDFTKWNKNTFQEYQPSPKCKSAIKKNWDKYIYENPNDYDGNLLFLDDFHFKDNNLLLDTSFMKFSTAMYMVKNNISSLEKMIRNTKLQNIPNSISQNSTKSTSITSIKTNHFLYL